MGLIRIKTRFYVWLVTFALLIVPSIAFGDQYSTLEGTITATPPQGFTIVSGAVSSAAGSSALDENGNYSITGLAATNVAITRISFVLDYEDPSLVVNSRLWIDLPLDESAAPITEVQIPAPELLTLTVADAQAQPIANSKLGIASEYALEGSKQDSSGNTWGMNVWFYDTSATGEFNAWVYPGVARELLFENENGSFREVVSEFSFPEGNNVKLCLPTNFGPDLAIADECLNAFGILEVKLEVELRRFLRPGQTLLVIASLQTMDGETIILDPEGPAKLTWDYDGPGFIVNSTPIPLDDGLYRAAVLIGANDSGDAQVTFTYDPGGAGKYEKTSVTILTTITSSPDYSTLPQGEWPNLTVSVVDHNGDPLEGAVLVLSKGSAEASLGELDRVSTNELGEGLFVNAFPGAVWVRAIPPDGEVAYDSPTRDTNLQMEALPLFLQFQRLPEAPPPSGGGGGFFPIEETPAATALTSNPIPAGKKVGAVDADGNAIDVIPLLAEDKKSLELSFGSAKLNLSSSRSASFSEDGKLAIAPKTPLKITASGYKPDSTTTSYLVPASSFVASAFKIASEEVIELGTATANQDGSFDFEQTIDAPAGSYLLQLSGTDSSGNALTVALETLVTGDQTMKTWAKRLPGNTEAKLYAKNIVGAGKVTFRVNGKEIAWIRAVDATDPKLRVITEGPMTGANYLVRTVKLNPGKNALEVYIDGERTTRVAYSRR